MKPARFYGKLLRSCDEPCWEVDCRQLGDFDKGVIAALSLPSALENPVRRNALVEWLNRRRLAGVVVAHLWPPTRQGTLRRYRTLYDAADNRRDFRYRVLEELLLDGESLLDVGCGTAPWFPRLARGREVVGVDVSPRMIRASHERHGGKFALANGARLPFDARRFDACCCFGVLLFVKEIQDLLDELSRSTRSLLAFDLVDASRISYVSPWNLRSLIRHYLGLYPRIFQHDLGEIEAMLNRRGFRLVARRVFFDGITDSTVVLGFRREP